MKRLVVYFFVVPFILFLSHQAFSQDLVIFSKTRPIEISYVGCATYKPIHVLRVNGETGVIYWKWENKSQAWCRWRTESLPESNFSGYLDGRLIIKFYGAYEGRPPEVEFIDSRNIHTRPVNFDYSLRDDPATGATVEIPLQAFGMVSDSSANPREANPREIKAIQFAAEYNSTRGKIIITYIELCSS